MANPAEAVLVCPGGLRAQRALAADRGCHAVHQQRFDDLTRTVATGLSRRRALRGLAGGALGGLLGLGRLRAAAINCQVAEQRCGSGRRCCPGGRCVNGRCTCKESEGFFACNGPGSRCINTRTDERFCGGCFDGQCGEDENCIDGVCRDACADGLRDGLETDIDCGGPDCPPCDNGKGCGEDADCVSDFCDADDVCREPHSCNDGVLNGRETDVDCGGTDCPGCADGLKCFVNADCENRNCDRPVDPNEPGVCGFNPTCNNGRKDGTETDVDCGGSNCPGCPLGKKCRSADDCQGALTFCANRRWDNSDKKFCVECANGAISADDACFALYGEARPVCVRNTCRECRRDADCPTEMACAGNACVDCGTVQVTGTGRAGAASEETCSDACGNGVKDGGETDTDCGGPDCPPCGPGGTCLADADCQSLMCIDLAEDGGQKFCVECIDDSHCSGAAVCTANACQVDPRGTCAEGQESCLVACNGNNFQVCQCYQTVGGQTICGDAFNLTCASCNADHECESVMGPGGFCVRLEERCACTDGRRTACTQRCLTGG